MTLVAHPRIFCKKNKITKLYFSKLKCTSSQAIIEKMFGFLLNKKILLYIEKNKKISSKLLGVIHNTHTYTVYLGVYWIKLAILPSSGKNSLLICLHRQQIHNVIR